MEQLLTKRQFKKGETVIQEGMESYDVYIILSGEAEVVKTYFDQPVSIRTLRKGDAFGASALIVKSPRFSTVVAKTDLTVGFIYRDDFLSILEKLPPEVNEIMKSMVNQLKAAYEVCAELAVNTKKMLSIKAEMESMQREKLKEYLTHVPEVVQISLISIEHGLADMVHNYSKLASQLDKTVSEVDTLFSQSIG